MSAKNRNQSIRVRPINPHELLATPLIMDNRVGWVELGETYHLWHPTVGFAALNHTLHSAGVIVLPRVPH